MSGQWKWLATAVMVTAVGDTWVWAGPPPEPVGPWQQVINSPETDIVIATRAIQGTNIREFTAETTVKSSLAGLVALIEDTDNLPNWMHRIGRVDIVHRQDDHDLTAYTVIKAPWPLHDRDTYLHTHLFQDSKTGTVTISSVSEPGGPGLQPGCIRMPEMDTDWIFQPLSGRRVKVTFRGFGLPGGVVPDWAVNLVVTDLPYGSLRNLKWQIQRQKYQNSHFDAIKEVNP
ncbi:MAG: hypothetical protein HKM02_11900 [Pseudomonadales bacterium]|nr:hypothetical protein [Pseudomonadales bacterium]